MDDDNTADASAPLGFEQWYAHQFPRVRATLTLATGHAGLAEEAAAEAFARALVRWSTLSRGGDPTGWAYRVALNLVRSRLRRLALERRYVAGQRLGHVPAPDPDPQVWAAVAQLGERARTAVLLRYVADLTEAQVADVMGIAPGTVAATLHKARGRLGELLADRRPRPTDLFDPTRS